MAIGFTKAKSDEILLATPGYWILTANFLLFFTARTEEDAAPVHSRKKQSISNCPPKDFRFLSRKFGEEEN